MENREEEIVGGELAQEPLAQAVQENPVQPEAPAKPAPQQSYTQSWQQAQACRQSYQPQAYPQGYHQFSSAQYGPYGQYQQNWQSQPGPWQALQQPVQQPRQPQQPNNTSQKRSGKGIAAAIGIVMLVAFACWITAAALKTSYDQENQRLHQQIQSQRESLNAMEQSLQDQAASYDQKLSLLEKHMQQAGASQGGGQATLGAMTPAQLYAQCVGSVVAISNEAGSGGGYTTVGTGSGFILTQDGYIVSNHHVVEGAARLTVTLTTGVTYEAKLIGSDNINDVALLKVEAEQPLPAVTIGSSDSLQVGDQVVAIGNPLGDLTTTATVGYISGKDRPVNTEGSIIDMLQTDAAINSGNSGGPLFNMYGEVVGITTAKYSGTTGSGASIEGIGFAIPIDDVYGLITDYKDHGFITGGYLGVEVSNMDSDVAQIYNLPVGAYVRKVTAGSCAEKGGIQVEDIIIGMGGKDVQNLTDLTRILRTYQAGDSVEVVVYRGGATLTLTVVLDPKPQQ